MAGDENQPLEPHDLTAARGDDKPDEELEVQAARVSADMLANILSRVPPRWLAASRCVCKAWRDTVDGRRLLRADLLPLSLAGLFVHYDEHKFPEFLARPSFSAAGSRAVSGDLSFLPCASGGPHYAYHHYNSGHDREEDFNSIRDHCNGLLLLYNNCVANPATRRWNTLPTCPVKHGLGNVTYRTHLVYDPMVSPYYEVYKIPTLDDYHNNGEEADPSIEESEWPPSSCKMYVFSSKSGYWEEKAFIREGDAAGTGGEVRARSCETSAAYFQGALYVHYKTDFLMRVSLSNNTYIIIKAPLGMESYSHFNVARSEKGLSFVRLDGRWHEDKCCLQVWILDESCGQMEWVLEHDKDLKHMLPHQWFCRQAKWILEDINYKLFRACSFSEDNKKETTEETFEWNSDEDVQDKDMVDQAYLEHKNSMIYDFELLGIHPYKQIVFLSASQQTCLAYHLNGSRIEELGNIYPKEYTSFKCVPNEREWIESFPYTPCWIEEFSGSN